MSCCWKFGSVSCSWAYWIAAVSAYIFEVSDTNWFHELFGASVWQVDNFSSAVVQLPLLCTLGFGMFGDKQTLSSSHKHKWEEKSQGRGCSCQRFVLIQVRMVQLKPQCV